jgi:hypothetical protein
MRACVRVVIGQVYSPKLLLIAGITANALACLLFTIANNKVGRYNTPMTAISQ